ncbi:histone deacetylase complex subunit SAP30 Sin3-binding domain-containing protein [Aspergillus clavatus NRRL 1]|uniref:Histone deacetylase complex subunit SAP30 Sin3 binding domain-containing protein n=1 Tax=Aspergillus clavatus (strain ATCC 1007 / CBS 513.65 / DSM 816 / NCTC 3887 / NRRL 1 / QM 1276 / 107) TaxID=344612 RepID=A1C6L8_ASPCL|nr:uncharacterized protein ACLA_070720 [Aspergillus clavatus NRRL 1]EAW14039.1 conserved hypothetical protein [Aspergillus clavatus NRRL 1]
MAPPRQRTAAVQDDSRSEASTSTREPKASTAKGRKTAATSSALNSVSSREIKASAPVANVTSAPANQAEHADELPKIPWSDMPLDFLHAYRHAYKLPCPSAFSGDYSQLLLSQGIGLRSPTALAAQRARLLQQQKHKEKDKDSANDPPASRDSDGKPSTNGAITRHHHHRKSQHPEPEPILHRISAQDRVSKKELATAVRKHFNSAALAEQEAIARFLYKVREEGRGRQFRLRFQP